MNLIRVLVVADDLGLAGDMLSLERHGRARVLGPVGDAVSALEPLDEGLVDVVVVDLDRSDGDALLILAQLREYAPGVKLMAVSNDMRADVAAVALASGAGGLLHRGAAAGQMLAGLDRLMAGELVLPGQSNGGGPLLTPRELEVTALLAGGMSIAEIAELLSISVSTVQSHVKRILGKLDVHSRMEAVRVVWREGLVPLPASA